MEERCQYQERPRTGDMLKKNYICVTEEGW